MKRTKQTKAQNETPKRYTSAGKRRSMPRTATQYQALPKSSKRTLERVLDAIKVMRNDKKSLTEASRDAGTTPKSIRRWASAALKKTADGRYTAKRTDNVLRPLRIYASDGQQEIIVRGFRNASQVGKYSAAVDRFIATGDASRLAVFEGKFIKDADGKEIPFLTDRTALKKLGSAGLLSFESLYSRTQ